MSSEILLLLQILPPDVRNYLTGAAASVTAAFVGGLGDTKAEKAFEEAVRDGLLGFLLEFGDVGEYYAGDLLRRNDVHRFFVTLIEDEDKASLPVLQVALHEVGLDTQSIEGFDLSRALARFLEAFTKKVQFTAALQQYVSVRQWKTLLKILELKKKPPKPPVDLDNLHSRYFDFIKQEFSHIKLKGISRGIYKSIPLCEIYTDLVFRRELPTGKAELLAQKKQNKETLAELRGERDDGATVKDILASRYTVITGGPGAGKSTVLKRIALAFALGEQDIHGCSRELLPIFLPIVRYANECRHRSQNGATRRTLREYLHVFYQEMELPDFTPLFDAYLAKGKALLLFDGLDEVVNEEERINMVAAMRRFLQSDSVHPKNRCVVTCRTASYTMASRFEPVRGQEFEQVQVQPFAIRGISAFLAAWYRWYEREVNQRPEGSDVADKACKRMVGIIEGDPKIGDIATNPLMLTILATIEHDCGGELPSTRAELYEECLNKLAGVWDRVRTELGADEARRSYWKLDKYTVDAGFIVEHLGPVALDMQRKAVLQISAKQLRESLAANLLPRAGRDECLAREYARDFLSILRRISGLIQEATTGVFEFIHASFREYLAARWLTDWSEDRPADIGEGLFTPEWREVVFLTAGSLKPRDAGEFLRAIIERREQCPQNVNLAGACVADIGEAKVPAGFLEDLLGELKQVSFGSYPAAERAVAAEAMGWLGDRRDLREFVPVCGGIYNLEDLGEKELEPFELGRFPVTNGWFEEFVDQGGYKAEEFWSEEGKKWLRFTETKAPGYWYERKWRCPNAPVVGVSWYEADAFCRWLTLRRQDGFCYCLPTEFQWQAVAAGQSKLAYPWGNEYEQGEANSEEAKIGKTSSVGIFFRGNTPETGISDLAGNVWEWTRSDYHGFEEMSDFAFDEELYNLLYVKKDFEAYFNELKKKERKLPTIRGGSWDISRDYSRCAARSRFYPSFWYIRAGFRCSRAVE